MKLLLLSLLVLIGATALAVLIKDDPGYVLISTGNWTLETTLALLVFVLALLFAALYYAIRFLARLRRMPRDVGQWRGQRRERKAHRALTHGLVELSEGQWRQAERDVLKYAGQADSPMLNYLAAARAAQEQGAEERRDRYLKLAHEAEPNAEIPVGLTQAELYLSEGRREQALATLRQLQRLMPAHPQVLKPLARLYREMGEWKDLAGLMPLLRKRRVFDESTLQALEREAHAALLRDFDDAGRLLAHWNGLPRKLREDDELLHTCAWRLMELGEGAQAEPLLRAALKRRRSDRLLHLYGLVAGSDPSSQLALVEGFLASRERGSAELLAAARLCLRNGLWGKAREYLEASLESDENVEARAELAVLLDKMGEREAALTSYRRAIGQASCCTPLVAAQVEMAEQVVPAIEAPKQAIAPPDTAGA